MVRVSNNVVGCLNLITLLLSIPIVAGGIWLTSRASTDCEKFLEKPAIVLGVFLLVVSLAGLVGAWCRISLLLWLYLVVMFLLIVVVFCFTIFAFVITNKGAGEIVSGRGYKEYRLGDYSNWLQKRVDAEKNWLKIRSCIQESKVCRRMEERNQTLNEFLRDDLSPLQSGCCKPPTACNFTYRSATVWDKPSGFESNISDCNSWQSDPPILCYDCQSCKAGVLANIKHDWKTIAVVNIIFLIILIAVYTVGCCAFRNNREENAYPRWKGHP
ncbi:Tetraspanin/Peripherin protein [Dioscorea alata]|uniref:Tetraspanin/Peripherin protein n=1 Tax=Dioscorea alata TaxID=55571 RepID=A0ACB7VDM9_DIOAL|nr:Tetraspanin/Peripherin protein [Dioscorea alata]